MCIWQLTLCMMKINAVNNDSQSKINFIQAYIQQWVEIKILRWWNMFSIIGFGWWLFIVFYNFWIMCECLCGHTSVQTLCQNHQKRPQLQRTKIKPRKSRPTPSQSFEWTGHFTAFYEWETMVRHEFPFNYLQDSKISSKAVVIVHFAWN